ncbi:hypothetical protein [Methylobacterium sp. 22177]|uniref:hypothetical protein n=1 Tax=Methylobacterium sp. 22177 TaxID=3453885 RepID=UPI003F86D874
MSAEVSASLERAATLTARAKAPLDREDEAEARRRASLHLLAAELRREAGAWDLCVENYDALTRHYLTRQDLRAAGAYLRKLMFVSERSPRSPERMEACLLAASVHLAFRQPAPANAAASEAAHVAARSSDPAGLERAADLFRRIGELGAEDPVRSLTAGCACGGPGTYIACCGAVAGEVPAEFQVRVVGPAAAPTESQANPWLAPGRTGIDVVLGHPGAAGECLNWVAVRVEGGRQSLITLPNWSGRAMRAARTALAMSLEDPDGTEGPSSAVLQVACGLEAFMNAIGYFVARSRKERWEGSDLPASVLTIDKDHFRPGPLSQRWETVANALLGPEWAKAARLEDMRRLMQLRNALVHFGSQNEEQLVPARKEEHELLERFRGLVPFRAAPRPWVDRLLTPELAEWSIVLGEGLIASFRMAWHQRQEAELDASLRAELAEA